MNYIEIKKDKRTYLQDEIEQTIIDDDSSLLTPYFYKSWSDLSYYKTTHFFHINQYTDTYFKEIKAPHLVFSKQEKSERLNSYKKAVYTKERAFLKIIEDNDKVIDSYGIILYYIDGNSNYIFLSLKKGEFCFSSKIYSDATTQISDMLKFINIKIFEPVSSLGFVYSQNKNLRFTKNFIIKIKNYTILSQEENIFEKYNILKIKDNAFTNIYNNFLRNNSFNDIEISIYPEEKLPQGSLIDLNISSRKMVIETNRRSEKYISFSHLKEKSYFLFNIILILQYLNSKNIYVEKITEKNFFLVNKKKKDITYKIDSYFYFFKDIEEIVIFDINENSIFFNSDKKHKLSDVFNKDLLIKNGLLKYDDMALLYTLHSMFFMYREPTDKFQISFRDLSYYNNNPKLFDVLYKKEDEGYSPYIISEYNILDSEYLSMIDIRYSKKSQIKKKSLMKNFELLEEGNITADIVMTN